MRRLPLLCVLLIAALAAPAAASASAPAPIVAVLDSGVDLRHPAFRGALWRNPSEIASNGVDDDGNGYVDDVHGADVVDGDGAPRDPRGHGTHVAGLVARGGGVRLMAVRVIGRDGTGSTADLAAGIHYAVGAGARVINLSVSGYGSDPAVQAALRRASEAAVTVVAAAGNSGRDLDTHPDYPASHRTPGMIVVGATARDGRLAAWSGRGTRSVDLLAPGERVRSAVPRRRYARMSGTSQATATVSRSVARMLRAAPAADPQAVRAVLLGTVDRAGGLAGAVVAGGVLDLRAALSALRP